MQERARRNEKIEWSLNATPLEVMFGNKGVTGYWKRMESFLLSAIIRIPDS